MKLTVTWWQELLFPYKSFLFATAVAIATFGMYNLKLTGPLLLIIFILFKFLLTAFFPKQTVFTSTKS